MKSSNMLAKTPRNRSRRDVETAIKETNTRTELCVQYSVSSIHTNVQTGHARSVSDDNKSVEMAYMGRVMQKLHLARRILNPVIDEIITTATIMSETELTASNSTPLCSLSRTEYQGALRASQIFNEVNQELTQKYRNRPLFVGKNFRFPLTKPIITMSCFASKSKSKNAIEKERIYIDKELMLKLIELYEILGETIKKLKQKQGSQKSIPDSASSQKKTSSVQVMRSKSPSDISRSSASSDESQPPPQIAARGKRSTQSSSTKKVDQIYQKAALKPTNKAASLFDSPQQAQERASKCLKTLSDVQAYMEVTRGGDVDLLNLFELVETEEKGGCNYKGSPHLHATLNGIPVILARDISLISNTFINKYEKSIQGSLIPQSFINKYEKPVQGSNYKFSSVQYSMEKASSLLSSSRTVHHSSSTSSSCCSCANNCPDDDLECICITTSSYSKQEIFSTSGVTTNVAGQNTESIYGLPSPTPVRSEDRVDAIISNEHYSLISTPEVELSVDSAAMKIKSDMSETTDIPARLIGSYSKSEVLPEDSVISSTTKSTLVPSSLGQSVVSEPSGNKIKTVTSSKIVEIISASKIKKSSETTVQSDITEETDDSVKVIDGLIEKDEVLSAGGAKSSTASQNTESLPELSSSGQPVGSAPSKNRMKATASSKIDKITSTPQVKTSSDQHAITLQSDLAERTDISSDVRNIDSQSTVLSTGDVTSQDDSQNTESVRELPSSGQSVESAQSDKTMKVIMSSKIDGMISTPQMETASNLSARKMQSDIEKIGHIPDSRSKSKVFSVGDVTSTTASRNAESISGVSSQKLTSMDQTSASTPSEMRTKSATSSKMSQTISTPQVTTSCSICVKKMQSDIEEISQISDSPSKTKVFSAKDVISTTSNDNARSIPGLPFYKSAISGQSDASQAKGSSVRFAERIQSDTTEISDISDTIVDSFSKNEVLSAEDVISTAASRNAESISGLRSPKSAIIDQLGTSIASVNRRKTAPPSSIEDVISTPQVKTSSDLLGIKMQSVMAEESDVSDAVVDSFSKNKALLAGGVISATASRNAESISDLSSHKSAVIDQSGTTILSDNRMKAATSSKLIDQMASSPQVKPSSDLSATKIKLDVARRSNISEAGADSFSKSKPFSAKDVISTTVNRDAESISGLSSHKSTTIDQSGASITSDNGMKAATSSKLIDQMASSPQVKPSSDLSATKMKLDVARRSNISEVGADSFSKSKPFSAKDVISTTASRDAESISGLSSHKSTTIDQSGASITSDNRMKAATSSKLIDQMPSLPQVKPSSDLSATKMKLDVARRSNISEVGADSLSKSKPFSARGVISTTASRDAESISGISSHKSTTTDRSGTSITSDNRMKAATSSKLIDQMASSPQVKPSSDLSATKMKLDVARRSNISEVGADSFSKSKPFSGKDVISTTASRDAESIFGPSSHKSTTIDQSGTSIASDNRMKAATSSKLIDQMASSPQAEQSSDLSATKMKLDVTRRSNISEVGADGFSKSKAFSAKDVISTTASRNAESISGLSSHKLATIDQSGTFVTSDNRMKAATSSKLIDKMASSPEVKPSSDLSANGMKSDIARRNDISEVGADSVSKSKAFSAKDVISTTASRNAENISGLSPHKSAAIDQSGTSITSDNRMKAAKSNKIIDKMTSSPQVKLSSDLSTTRMKSDIARSDILEVGADSFSKSKAFSARDMISTTASRDAESISGLSSHKSATIDQSGTSITSDNRIKAAMSSKIIDKMASSPQVKPSSDISATRMKSDTARRSDVLEVGADSFSKSKAFSAKDVISTTASRDAETISRISSHKSATIGQYGTSITSNNTMKATTSSKIDKMASSPQLKPSPDLSATRMKLDIARRHGTSEVAADSYSKSKVFSTGDVPSATANQNAERKSAILDQSGASILSDKKASKSSKINKMTSVSEVKSPCCLSATSLQSDIARRSDISVVVADSCSRCKALSTGEVPCTTDSLNTESIAELSSHKSAFIYKSGASILSHNGMKSATSSKIDRMVSGPQVKTSSGVLTSTVGSDISDISDTVLDSGSAGDVTSTTASRNTESISASTSKGSRMKAATLSKIDKMISTPKVGKSSTLPVKTTKSDMTVRTDISDVIVDEYYRNDSFPPDGVTSNIAIQNTDSISQLSTTGPSVGSTQTKSELKTILSRRIDKMISVQQVKPSDLSIRRVQSDMTEASNISFRIMGVSKSTSEKTFGSRGQKSDVSGVEWIDSDLLENKQSRPSQRRLKGSSTYHKNGKTFKVTDLVKLAKPAKCCRKSYLNEPLQTTTPYPVSLLSLHLDDNDTKLLTKKIKSRVDNSESQITYCTCMRDRKFHIEQRVFQIAYFTVSRSMKNYSPDLTECTHSALKKH